MEIEIFEIDGGFGYRVGSVYQEYDPELPGFIPMTYERAETMAQIIKGRLENS